MSGPSPKRMELRPATLTPGGLCPISGKFAPDGCHNADTYRADSVQRHTVRAHGGPTAAFMLTQPFYQRIFFADTGRRAAHTLIKEVQQQPSS